MKKLLIILLAALAAGAYIGYTRWRTGARQPAGEAAREKRILYYHCPMHPDYHSDHPGDCPVCGMRLEPVYAGEQAASHAVSGQIHITPERQQLIGVRVGEAALESLVRTIRAAGKVALDETRLAKIHPRVEGWIESVQADFLGQHVEQGQPLLRIYSPELFTAQQEYLLALKSRDLMSRSSMAGARAGSEALVQASLRRLQLWNLSDDQIDAIRETREPSAVVTLHSPASGYVIARNAYTRQRVTPDTELYTVADLSRVWVMADVFPADMAAISVGQQARVELAYPSSRTFPARVDYIQPALDPVTRTMRVRLALDNPGLWLKPEMFVSVEFRTAGARRLVVPVSAVLDSGLTQTVFVALGEGYFEPRAVRTGEQTEDKVEILSGLAPGERIVTSGTFLIDSESQLKAAVSGIHHHD
ncbi:MAG: efflux RND transporter periplasmic adaptor subunit [Bryobacterales bacterium]|nr:efflux RND transporter periplasmic adaptor subunit [Bryobacterales bacterium]